jgi:hypothetical protein
MSVAGSPERILFLTFLNLQRAIPCAIEFVQALTAFLEAPRFWTSWRAEEAGKTLLQK